MRKFLNFVGLNIDFKNDIIYILIANIVACIAIYILALYVAFVNNESVLAVLSILEEKMSLTGTIYYGLFCFIQEILARGILQRFLKRKINNTFLAIIITTINFCMCHINYSFIVIIGACIISIISGILTNKTDNILAGFAFHWTFGGFGYILMII